MGTGYRGGFRISERKPLSENRGVARGRESRGFWQESELESECLRGWSRELEWESNLFGVGVGSRCRYCLELGVGVGVEICWGLELESESEFKVVRIGVRDLLSMRGPS